MLKSNLGNYSIIVDGTWGEISYNNEVVEYGNIEDQLINTQNILLNYIVKDIKQITEKDIKEQMKTGKNEGIIKKWLSQFNDEELKTFRIAYAKNADSDTMYFLTQGGYTVESYINSLQ